MSFQSHAAIPQYHATLQSLKAQNHVTEAQTRRAFESLLVTLSAERGFDFVAEFPVGAKNKRKIDGVVKKRSLPLGYWEAKDQNDKLEEEIQKKIKLEYPTSNTIFEDTRHAILWQNQKPVGKFDLSKTEEVGELLDRFFGSERKGFEQPMSGLNRQIQRQIADVFQTFAVDHNRQHIHNFLVF